MDCSRITPRPPIRVEIENGDKGRLKVVWDDTESQFYPYQIDAETVEAEANKIRKKLAALVRASMEEPLAPYGPLIKDIARAGKDLYDALFTDAGPSEQDVRKVLRWFDGLRSPHRIFFRVDGFIHIPWHLIYDADPEQLPEDEAEDLSVYKSFWCLKYLVSCMYSGITPQSESADVTSFRLLPVLHKAVYELASKHLPEEEKKELLNLFKEFGMEIFSRKSLIDAWTSVGNLNRVLFFFCHANGTTLALSESEEDPISLVEFKKKLRFVEGATNAVSLTFLNGCSTAAGKATQGFIEATSRPGHCGFIGTETEIPNVYALRFGTAFLRCLGQTGWSLFEVMDAMRHLHWPLSLIYGLYAHAGFKVTRNSEATIWTTRPANFSRGPIGAEPL